MSIDKQAKNLKWLRILNNETGSELVEFALSICIVLACMFGILYVSLALYTDHFVANAAKEGARYAMVRGSSWGGAACTTTSTFSCTATSANVNSYVKSTLTPGLADSDLSVSTSWPGTTPSGATCDTTNGDNSPYCVVEVKVSYSFASSLPFIPQKTLAFSSTSIVPITE
jgi:Flp pilus assembly protein TadG